MMGLGFPQDDHPVAPSDHDQLVARFRLQGLARLARDHDLVLRREVASVMALRFSTK
jgi:hypothetical protein